MSGDMARQEIYEFLEGVLGRKKGWVELGDIDREGTGLWNSQFVEWPRKHHILMQCAESLSKGKHDVYISSHVYKTPARKAIDAIDLSVIHADLDHEKNGEQLGGSSDIDFEKARMLGVGVVRTSRHNFQLFMRLEKPARDLKEYQDLCYRLGHTFALDPSDVDAKISPGDMLRFPGTVNHKRDGDETEIIWPVGRRGRVSGLVPSVPDSVKNQQADGDATRSGQVWRILHEYAEKGRTFEKARIAIEREFPGYEEDHPGDLERIWKKAHHKVQVEEELEDEKDEYTKLLKAADAFIFDAPACVPALWGVDGEDVWWSPGEGLMVTGLTGVGKSTLAGLLLKGRMGYLPEGVAGFPVKPGMKKTLYLALDRPKQIQRALRRQLGDLTRMQVAEKLAVIDVPLPTFEKDPKLLLKLALAADADTIIVDSLKDVVSNLADEKAASSWNANVKYCLSADIEVVVLHHQRKSTNGEGSLKPKTIHDVYGSTLIPASLGSVLLLWRDARKEQVEMLQLKGPQGEGDKLELTLDNMKGTMSAALGEHDRLEFFSDPATVKQYAAFIAGVEEADVQQKDSLRASREIKGYEDRLLIQKCAPPADLSFKGRPPQHYRRS